MQVNIQGHGLELTEPLKVYASKKVNKLQEFFNNIMKADIILDARKIEDSARSHVAEVNIWVARKKVIRASEAGQDMYAAIDLVFDELKRQLKKHKDKLIHEKRREGEKIKKTIRSFKPEIITPSEPQIVQRRNFNIVSMTKEEALEEQKLLDQEFIVFRNIENGEACLLYKNEFIDSSNIKPLSHKDAAETLKNSEKAVIGYLNPLTNQINILYKRLSGNFGLIEPSL